MAPGTRNIFLCVIFLTVVVLILMDGWHSEYNCFVIGVGLMLACLAALAYDKMWHNTDSRIETNADIMNALWGDRYKVYIYDIVAELKDGLYQWREGWNLERLNRDYELIVAEIEKTKPWIKRKPK